MLNIQHAMFNTQCKGSLSCFLTVFVKEIENKNTCTSLNTEY